MNPFGDSPGPKSLPYDTVRYGEAQGHGGAPGPCLSTLAIHATGRGVDRAMAVRHAEAALADEGCLAAPGCVWRAFVVLVCADELAAADTHWLSLAGLGLPGIDDVLVLARARMARLHGDIEGAYRMLCAVLADRASPVVRKVGIPWLVELLAELGDGEQALAVAAQHDFDRLIAENLSTRPLLLSARGAALLASRRFSEGIEDLLACGSDMCAWGMTNPALLPWRSRAALAMVSGPGGDEKKEIATRLAVEEWTEAMRWGAPRTVGWALFARAEVEGGEDRFTMFEEAVELLEVSHARAELSRVCLAVGRRLAEAGDSTIARERLHRAAVLARWSGNAARSLQAQQALNQLEETTPGQSLTRQETKIASLARAGLSNKEIAGRLFLTVRTVEFHLSSVYRKLGVSGRRGLRSIVLDPA